MGYFLADDDTSFQFVVGSGNHRLAALTSAIPRSRLH
jgi:hypothetical protein